MKITFKFLASLLCIFSSLVSASSEEHCLNIWSESANILKKAHLDMDEAFSIVLKHPVESVEKMNKIDRNIMGLENEYSGFYLDCRDVTTVTEKAVNKNKNLTHKLQSRITCGAAAFGPFIEYFLKSNEYVENHSKIISTITTITPDDIYRIEKNARIALLRIDRAQEYLRDVNVDIECSSHFDLIDEANTYKASLVEYKQFFSKMVD
jgi:hypothetical protein